MGKTRLALEICRDAAWQRGVLYVEDGSTCDVVALLERLRSNSDVRVVVVVDEVSPDQARRWNGIVARAPSRLRLLTIGLTKPPPGYSILEHDVVPLAEAESVALLRTTHPSLPDEHVEFAARFSSGFPKLGRVAADALEKDRSLDLRGLLARGEIRRLLDSLIGDPARRRSLYVLAALDSVGWENARAEEGRAVAEHLGLDWAQVRTDVEALHASKGIAPRAGDLRYISPRPLGVLLAVEAWQANPDLMRSLAEKLPTDAARRAYEERLRLIAGSGQVEAFAATELGRFRQLRELTSAADAHRWEAVGHAQPTLAARYMRDALAEASRDERRALAAGARRELVWALERLARRDDCFSDAIWALAHLAVAETESYGNNATGELISKFQLFLGGTTRAYPERLAVIDELLRSPTADYRVLAVKALARPIATGGEMSFRGDPGDFEPRAPPWRPTNQQELADAVFGALDRLRDVARTDAAPEVRAALVEALGRATMQLRVPAVRDRIAAVVVELGQRDSAARERLWHEVHRIVSSEERHWKQLGEADVAWLRALLVKLEDESVFGKIRRAVGRAEWDVKAADFATLAAELVATPDAWTEVWTWLTGGRASGAWAFGEALTAADVQGRFLAHVETLLPGPDLRALAALLGARAQREAAGWIDRWIDAFALEHPLSDAIIELTWRTGGTPRGVARILEQVRAGASARATEHLSYGGWATSLDEAEIVELVRGLAAAQPHRGSAVVLLDQRVERDASLLVTVADLALDLVCDPELVRASPNHGDHWHRLALLLVPANASRIAGALFAAHDPRTRERGWFLEHETYPAVVLRKCIETDAGAVWSELRPYLDDPSLAAVYTIGLPNLLDDMPHADVLAWIDADPATRGSLAARIISKNLSDGSLLLDVLGAYGHVPDVAESVRAEFFSGEWWGDASAHWERVAQSLGPLAARSARPRAARWAKQTIAQLEKAAARERRDEAEARVRGRGAT